MKTGRMIICILLLCAVLCGCTAPAPESNVQKSATDQVLEEFARIAEIPRMSGHEEAITQYIMDRAQEMGFETSRDEYLNVVVDIPASKGYENVPLTILQAHTDMVCIGEEGLQYDPLVDPIKLVNDGKLLTADGTSLGADNGIGLAVIMYLLQDDALVHGPLRILLTSNEETSMGGAAAVDAALLAGAKYLLNIDSEEGGTVCTSSAGANGYLLSRSIKRESAEGIAAVVSVSGLLGGHSGMDIGAGRANAITELANMLVEAHGEGIEFRIADMQGGVALNAIPTSAEVTLVFADEEGKMQFSEYLMRAKARFAETYGEIEKGSEISMNDAALPATALTSEDSAVIWNFVAALPYGVYSMSPYVDGLVETSSNASPARMMEDRFEIEATIRSASVSNMELLVKNLGSMCEQAGFGMEETFEPAPIWEENPDSELLVILTDAYKEVSGKEMLRKPVHVGLECSWFAAKAPGIELVSVGPTIHNAHTPSEAVELDSIHDLVETVRLTIARIAGVQ